RLVIVKERTVELQGGIAYQNIDAAESVGDALRHPVDVRFAGDVGLDENTFAARRLNAPQRLFGAGGAAVIMHGHLHAPRAQFDGDALADPRSRPADDGSFAGQVHAVSSILST